MADERTEGRVVKNLWESYDGTVYDFHDFSLNLAALHRSTITPREVIAWDDPGPSAYHLLAPEPPAGTIGQFLQQEEEDLLVLAFQELEAEVAARAVRP